MRRTLFYIPHSFFELTSIKIGGFTLYIGWLLIAWVLFAIGLMAYLIWRQGWNRDTSSYLPIIVFIALAFGFLMPHFEVKERDDVWRGVPAARDDPAAVWVGLPIRGYGMMVMLGAVAGVGLAIYRGRRMGLHHDAIQGLAWWMCICGMVGARAFYVIQKWPDVRVVEEGQFQLGKTLVSVVSIQSGGLVVYGSVIGAVAAAVVYLRMKKLPMLAIGDLVAPAMLVGLCLGRIGCLLNGCCHGGICEPENPFHWAALSFPRDAEPRISREQNPENRENSPPYHRQRAAGWFHAVRIAIAEDGQPVIADVDNSIIKDDAPDIPRKDDRIQSIPFVERPSGEKKRKEASEKTVSMLFNGLNPAFYTSKDEIRRWSIKDLPDVALPVHPSQIYSSINAGLMALFLWFLYPFRRRDGQVFAVMLIIYPIARTLLELIRDDERGQFGTDVTVSQWFSGVVILLGMALMWHIFRQPKEQGLTKSFASS